MKAVITGQEVNKAVAAWLEGQGFKVVEGGEVLMDDEEVPIEIEVITRTPEDACS